MADPLVSDLIAKAAEIGYGLGQGETPNTSEQARMFGILVDEIMPVLKADPLYAYAEQTITGTLAAATQSRTLGPGGNLDYVRPVYIKPQGKIRLGGFEHDLHYTTKRAEWAQIHEYTTALAPRIVYDNGGFPLRTLLFDPKPSGTPDVELYALLGLEPFDDVTDPVTVPPGYQLLLKLWLASEIVDHFGMQMPPSLPGKLQAVQNAIRAQNAAFMGVSLSAQQPAAQGA